MPPPDLPPPLTHIRFSTCPRCRYLTSQCNSLLYSVHAQALLILHTYLSSPGFKVIPGSPKQIHWRAVVIYNKKATFNIACISTENYDLILKKSFKMNYERLCNILVGLLYFVTQVPGQFDRSKHILGDIREQKISQVSDYDERQENVYRRPTTYLIIASKIVRYVFT